MVKFLLEWWDLNKVKLEYRAEYVAAKNSLVHRRIIICLDGTWNDKEAVQPFTNVVRLQALLAAKVHRNGTTRYEQISYYIDGIGTNTTWFGRKWDGAFGTGMRSESQSV